MIPGPVECDKVLLVRAELDGDLDAEATATELMLAAR
jgi:hypothetical protein